MHGNKIISFQNKTNTCECIYVYIIDTAHLIVAREGELRQLRKQTTELEEQNAILRKHIDSMKHAIEKLELEAVQQRSTNMALQGHIDHIGLTVDRNPKLYMPLR